MLGGFGLGSIGLGGTSVSFGSTFIINGDTDTITTMTGLVPTDGQQIMFLGGGDTGLLYGQTYYVINVVGNTFQLALSPDGDPINLQTGAVSGLLLDTQDQETTDILVGAAHGYIERIKSSDGSHVAHHTAKDDRGNFMKVWGTNFGRTTSVGFFSSLGQMDLDQDYVPHDIIQIKNQRLAVLIARTDETIELWIYNLDGELLQQYTGLNKDTGWVHTVPLKLDVDCDMETLYYTDQGRTVFKFDTTNGVQLTPHEVASVGSVRAALRVVSEGTIIVNTTAAGNGPLRGLALDSDGINKWVDEINPGDSIYDVFKRRISDELQTASHVVEATPQGLNDEVFCIASAYRPCVLALKRPRKRPQGHVIG